MRSSWIALGFGALASSAMAADLPRKAPPVSPVQSVQAANWTGLYVGVHGGYSWGRWNGDLTFDPGGGPIEVFDPANRTIDGMAGSREGRLDSTISSTPLSSELKRMRRGQTSKGAEVSIQLPATSTGRLKIDWIGSGPSAAERASR
jgi:opacity protein-like surface antigen